MHNFMDSRTQPDVDMWQPDDPHGWMDDNPNWHEISQVKSFGMGSTPLKWKLMNWTEMVPVWITKRMTSPANNINKKIGYYLCVCQ